MQHPSRPGQTLDNDKIMLPQVILTVSGITAIRRQAFNRKFHNKWKKIFSYLPEKLFSFKIYEEIVDDIRQCFSW